MQDYDSTDSPRLAGRWYCLLADDDALLRMLLFERLTRAGYAVVTACNGEEALLLAKQLPPDVVILDKQMPRLNGYETISAMRAVEPLRRTPMILMSGVATPDEAKQAAFWGFQGFIQKPIRVNELIELIGKLVRPRQWPETARREH